MIRDIFCIGGLISCVNSELVYNAFELMCNIFNITFGLDSRSEDPDRTHRGHGLFVDIPGLLELSQPVAQRKRKPGYSA